MIVTLLGILGTIGFAISGIPVAIQTVKTGKCLVPIPTAFDYPQNKIFELETQEEIDKYRLLIKI